MLIDESLVERCYRDAKGERWPVAKDRFALALQSSAEHAFQGRTPDPRELKRYLTSLHLEDLALASACAAGDEGAWDHFVLTQRPLLYRAADAIDPGGEARDLADSLYADLFGVEDRAGERQSLFRYFHGRSSLTTWLRAVLAQRHVDRVRAHRRFDPLPDEDSSFALAAPSHPIEPDLQRYLTLIRDALGRAVAGLAARDRLRLACYYAQEMTLAQTGRILKEHEATVSRALARTRTAIRQAVERDLRETGNLTDGEIARCFECGVEDAGPLNLRDMLDLNPAQSTRKETAPDRSS